MIYRVFKDNYYPFNQERNLEKRIIARGIIVSNDKKILMEEIVRDDIFAKNHYIETPGGGVELNETLEQGLIREIEEETSYIVSIDEYIGLIEDEYNLISRKNMNHYFLCHIVSKGKQHLEEYEQRFFKSIKFYTLDEILNILSSPKTELEKIVYLREKAIIDYIKERL